ncbi:hypothetical protein ACFXGI_02605 [Streptomyces sp. NPDC059355]|uniref:hypothetical protein n=1 Tax=Streptomyces sp. NPDC059355 TaxID=3346811 RepID=UPI00367CC504
MANEPVNTPIQTKYTQQLAADLSANQDEQATLTTRLNQLQAEEKWLTAALESLHTADESDPTPPQGLASSADSVVLAGAGAAEAAVPKPRTRKKADGAASVRKAVAKKAAVKTAPARKPTAGKKPAVNRADENAKPAEPTLGQLLTEILSKQPGEPKKVSEIRIELEAAHPRRTSSDPVIRATLEKLVTKGVLEKDNRQRMVLYTWPALEQASAPASQTKPEQPAAEPSEAASVGV